MCNSLTKVFRPQEVAAPSVAPSETPQAPAIARGFSFDDTDVRYLACTLYGEARGEPVEGQIAVAWVIRNRASRRRFVASPGTVGAVRGACLAPWQFSCWNVGDPNSARLRDWAGRALDSPPAELRRLEALARDVLTGAVPDNTNGGDHYHTVARPGWAEVWPPDWAGRMTESARFFGHVFYDSRRGR